jgi:hypothetical protein
MTVSEAEPTPVPAEPEPADDEDEDADAPEDEDADDTDAPDAAAKAERPLTEKELEAREKKIEAENIRHAKRVSEIYAEEALGLVECEACAFQIHGFHWPADAYPPDSPLRSLYELLSGGTDAQMKHPAYFVTCEECNGFGNVLTGARTDITRTIACPVCKTAGYLDKRQQGTPPPAVAAAPVNGGEPAAPAEPHARLDFWGRPKGHPRYGDSPIELNSDELASDRADGFNV